jgi:transcriptional regulator with XRE-family HTH domain
VNLEAIFGKILKSARIKKNLSQEELAFQSDLDRTYISMLERGIHQPTLETIFKLSSALKISPSSLVKLVESEFNTLDKK